MSSNYGTPPPTTAEALMDELFAPRDRNMVIRVRSDLGIATGMAMGMAAASMFGMPTRRPAPPRKKRKHSPAKLAAMASQKAQRRARRISRKAKA
jgi:hypothetical protein